MLEILNSSSFTSTIINIGSDPVDATVRTVEPLNEPVSEPVKITEVQKNILEIMKKKPKVTKEELEDIIKKSRATLTRNIAKLKDLGLLIRIGSDKTGHWQVKEDNR